MADLDWLRRAIRHEGGISRRLFLAQGAALAALPLLGSRPRGAIARRPSFAADPFTLGVASGDPDETGVLIWTRLAPRPLEPGGGMPEENVAVQWEVAEDEGLAKIVRRGEAAASRTLAHSLHVEVEGLQPDRWYFYRFRSGDAQSPVGRTRTLPSAAARPETLRLAFASCQHFEDGLFTAYRRMAEDELDLVIHLGDYIYEYGGKDGRVRKHQGGKILTLDDYRIRHAQYRSDPLLHGMHARCPWLVTWDDHEVENNYADGVSERANLDPATFLLQRANAYQAYYEMMPLRPRSLPRGPHARLHRAASFGRLAEFLVLDTRQYRSDQPNGDKGSELNEAALAPTNSLLGAEQRAWVESTLIDSRATWNVLAQQVMMAMIDHAVGEPKRYSMDTWTGAMAERSRLMTFLAEKRIANPVVLTGDIHSNWVNDLRVDDRKPETPVVATEFVGTSLSSGGNGSDRHTKHDQLLAENPCVRFHNRQRGYVRCTVTPSAWRSDYLVIDDVTKPGGNASVRSSFVVEAGQPGSKPA